MKKRIFILFLLLILSGFGLYRLNRDFLLLWNSNTIHITAESPLTADKVKIEFGISVNTISRANDTDLFHRREKYTVLYDSTIQNKLMNAYGENDFLITYNNRYYFSFRQFKINRRHQHDYNFHFYQKENIIFVRINIKGKDAMKFERPMLEK